MTKVAVTTLTSTTSSTHAGHVLLRPELIRNQRIRHGLSQDRLADLACSHRRAISLASIKRAESGRPVRLRTAHALAELLGLRIADLMADCLSPREQPNSAYQLPLPGRQAHADPAPSGRLLLSLCCDIGKPDSDLLLLAKTHGARLVRTADAPCLIFGLPRAEPDDLLRALRCGEHLMALEGAASAMLRACRYSQIAGLSSLPSAIQKAQSGLYLDSELTASLNKLAEFEASELPAVARFKAWCTQWPKEPGLAGPECPELKQVWQRLSEPLGAQARQVLDVKCQTLSPMIALARALAPRLRPCATQTVVLQVAELRSTGRVELEFLRTGENSIRLGLAEVGPLLRALPGKTCLVCCDLDVLGNQAEAWASAWFESLPDISRWLLLGRRSLGGLSPAWALRWQAEQLTLAPQSEQAERETFSYAALHLMQQGLDDLPRHVLSPLQLLAQFPDGIAFSTLHSVLDPSELRVELLTPWLELSQGRLRFRSQLVAAQVRALTHPRIAEAIGERMQRASELEVTPERTVAAGRIA